MLSLGHRYRQCSDARDISACPSVSGEFTGVYLAWVTEVSSRPCNSLPGLKRTAFPGGMLTSSPVRGLRPMPVLRGFRLKTPKLRNSMRGPRPRAVLRDSNTVSTACSALVRLMLVLVTTALTMSSLIKRNLPGAWADARGCGAGCQDVRAYTTLIFLCGKLLIFRMTWQDFLS